MDKSDIRFVLDLSLRQISLNSIFRPVNLSYEGKTRYFLDARVFCRAGAAAKTLLWFFLVLVQNLLIALGNDVLLIDFSV